MSEAEITRTVSAALQEAGLLDGFMLCAQQAGLSLLGYLERCSNASVIQVSSAQSAESDEEAIARLWEEQTHEPPASHLANLRRAYNDAHIDEMSGEELRWLCQD